MDLNNLSKDQLLTLVNSQAQAIEKNQILLGEHQQTIQSRDLDILYYKAQIEKLKRLAFGQKRERFEGNNQAQLPLPFAVDPILEKKQEEQLTEKISYLRKKPSTHQGRLPLPDHLPVEEI